MKAKRNHWENVNDQSGKEIREILCWEPVPPQIHRAIADACADLPERPQKAKRRLNTGWKTALASFALVGAAFVGLCCTNFVNPAFAESIPLVGEAFRKYNREKKLSVGTYVGTYGNVSAVNSQAAGGEAEGFTLTAQEAYSDGIYVHLSFSMEAQDWEALSKRYAYVSLPLSAQVNGESLETAYLNLNPADGVWEGTLALRLNRQAEDGETLSLMYRAENMIGILSDSWDKEELPAVFSGSLSLTADASHNRVMEHFGGSDEIQIEKVEATPSYTKITYQIPYWGISSYVMDFPRLYLADGTGVRRTASESDVAAELDREKDTVTSTWHFDGLPNGTEQVILRFLDCDADENGLYAWTGTSRKAQVLGEVTIDLTTGKAVPSATYEEDGLSFAGDYRSLYTWLRWHAGFDDVSLREGYPRQMDLFEVSDLFQNGIALENMDYEKGKDFTAHFMCTGPLNKDLRLTLQGEDGQILAVQEVSAESVRDNETLLNYDSREEMLREEERKLREMDLPAGEGEDVEERIQAELEAIGKTEPGKYYFKAQGALLPGRELRQMDRVTVTLSDKESGESVYQRQVRLERKED